MRFFGTVLVVAILVGLPWGYASYRHKNFRNVRTVKEGVLYRSGQLSKAGLERLVFDHGIKTVISMRDSDDPSKPPPDLAEEKYCADQAIQFVRLSPKKFWSADGSIPAQANVDQFLEVLRNPKNHPVLVHCFAGIHRTGAMVAVYRMEFEGWTNAEALEELRENGYDNLDEEWDVLEFLERYKAKKR